ncbi:MAG: glycosyltransferase family 9 protein, partial [Planctomycetota bacterium]
EAARAARRGVILQPGAIGDCILTLPLAEFMKNRLGLGGIDILGHTEYIGILPGRTCVDGIRSIDSMDLHRLFSETKAFDLADGDPLINVFADYVWIATFLGEPNSSFEQNLIFTANCSHSAEVITLSMQPPKDFGEHLADFYIQQFISQSGLSLQPWRVRRGDCLIKSTKADVNRGRELLEEIDVDFSEELVVIQPGSGGEHKCWHLDNYLAVAKELSSRGIEVIFLLGPAEVDRFSKGTIKNINSFARCLTDLSLTQVLGLLSCADGFVGNDSGITHLSAGLGIKTLGVFGPTNPAVYGPIGPAITVFADSTAAFVKEPSAALQRELLDVLMA